MRNGPLTHLFVLLLLSASPPSGAAVTTGSKLATCSWNSPGTNPYRGELAVAVDHYTDIPAPTREALKARIAVQRYDDIAVIGRNHITGTWRYSPELRDMHFGQGRLCRSVTRQRWAAQAEERGLVYCEGSHCVIVPTVCRNVSRVTRKAAVTAQPGAGADLPTGNGSGNGSGSGSGGAPAQALVLLPESSELVFEAPSAGRALGSGSEALPWTGPQALTLVAAAPDGGAALPGILAGRDADATAATAVANVAPPGPTELPTPVVTLQEPVALNGNGSFGGGGPATPAQPLAPLLPNTGMGGPPPGLPDIAPPLGAAVPVPEPAAALLMLLGLAALWPAVAASAAKARAHRVQRPQRV